MGMIATYESLSNARFNIALKVDPCVNLPERSMRRVILYLSPSLANHLFFQKNIMVQHQKTFGISSG